jgi:hypothetical protein
LATTSENFFVMARISIAGGTCMKKGGGDLTLLVVTTWHYDLAGYDFVLGLDHFVYHFSL